MYCKLIAFFFAIIMFLVKRKSAFIYDIGIFLFRIIINYKKIKKKFKK